MGAVSRINTDAHKRKGDTRLTVVIQVNHAETGDPAAPARDRDLGKVELDALYEVKVSVSLARSRRGMRMQGRRHVGLRCQARGKSGSRKKSRRGGSSFEEGQ